MEKYENFFEKNGNGLINEKTEFVSTDGKIHQELFIKTNPEIFASFM